MNSVDKRSRMVHYVVKEPALPRIQEGNHSGRPFTQEAMTASAQFWLLTDYFNCHLLSLLMIMYDTLVAFTNP